MTRRYWSTTSFKPPTAPIRRCLAAWAGYIGHAIRQHGLPIYSNVIYLRPNAGQRDPGHYIQEHLGYEITIRYRVIRLIEIEGQPVLDAGIRV